MENFIGQTFGHLTVVKFSHTKKGRGHFWGCQCDCGKETTALGYSLKSSRKISCGCISNQGERKHLAYETKTYSTWKHMKSRCANPRNDKYHLYGGKGIKVCERWNDFKNFISDMGIQPEGTTIGRMDGNGDYCPENCRWETPYQQNRNISTNKYITYGGKTMILADWSKETGISQPTLRRRLKQGLAGDALFAMPQKRTRKGTVEARGAAYPPAATA